MASPAQIAANVRYNRKQDSITIRPDKATGAAIRAAAERADVPLQRFIIDCCLSCMDGAPDPAASTAEPEE